MATGPSRAPAAAGSFPGTLNLTAQTFSLVVRDVLMELFRQKARKIVVINGHYENIWPPLKASNWPSMPLAATV